ncbi:MAG: flavin reductase family protein [Candidatus Binatia bacterium]
MNDDARKTALRMIPYGLYVLTAEAADGKVAAATVNWVTQASFDPPLVAVGVKADSLAYTAIKESGSFALNVLGKNQQALAYNFFKPHEREGQSIGGESFTTASTGSPLLDATPAQLECKLVETVKKGDHAVMVAEVVDARVNEQPEGRPDDATLWLRDLGEKVFYGG